MTINKAQQTFSIGDHWVYYKIYCGVYFADTILVNIIKPLSERLLKENIILKWFFIRYKDPDSHLRIRFFIKDLKDFGTVIELIQISLSPYIKSKEIWDIQLHSYKRELERYGDNTIEIAESLFYYDSEMIVNALEIKAGAIEYFLFVIKAADCILSYLEYEDDKKLFLVEQTRTAFKKEFNIGKTTVKQMDAKYRSLQKQIESTLKLKSDSVFNNLIEIKNNHIQPVIKELLTNNKNGTLLVDSNELLSSYIHMTVNRSFRSKQRLHELLIYDMLYRFYKSKIARK